MMGVNDPSDNARIFLWKLEIDYTYVHAASEQTARES